MSKKNKIVFLALVAATVTTLGFASCNKEENYKDQGENGVYYYVTENGDTNTIILSKGQYTLVENGESKNGMYKYNGSTFDFGEYGSATVSEGVLSLTQNGGTYNYYMAKRKRIRYHESFRFSP